MDKQQTKQMAQAVAAAMGTVKPIGPGTNNVTGRAGKPAQAYAASIMAIRKADKDQVKAKADEWADKGFQFARKCEAQVESRKAWVFEFANATAAQARNIVRGIVGYYAGLLEALELQQGHFAVTDDKKLQSLAGRKQKATLMQRRYELTSVVNGFAALADMAATGDDGAKLQRKTLLDELRSYGWNQLVAACASLHSASKGGPLTVADAQANAKRKEQKQAVADKAKRNAGSIYASLKADAIALAQMPEKAKALGIDVAMLLRALGAKHDAAVAQANKAPNLRDEIKARVQRDEQQRKAA